MLQVLTPEEVYEVIIKHFEVRHEKEAVSLMNACDRVLSDPVVATSDEPPFDRSTVDGYAVHASDTFGTSDSLPAMLEVAGTIRMGEPAKDPLRPGTCLRIPTGGAVPPEADAIVMQEYIEDYEDGTVGVTKAVSPGENMVFAGDDVHAGDDLLPAGKTLHAADIALLASLGITHVPVRPRLRVAVLSTGDELVPEDQVPAPGQIRDVNSRMLAAICEEAGCLVDICGIIKDDESLLKAALTKAIGDYDLVLVSGGSSVGEKDHTVRALASLGELLFHGISMKPGKPTLLGKVNDTPVFGLPGHPQAAFFVAKLFVCALIDRLYGRTGRPLRVPAQMAQSVSSNDGRQLYIPVCLSEQDGVLLAEPLRSKSGLVSSLTRAQGYLCIPRNCEGVTEGKMVMITLF